MGSKLTKAQAGALSAIKREGSLSGHCLSGCFGVHGGTMSALVRLGLVVGTVSNPTAEQRWRLTDAGRLSLQENTNAV